MYTQVVMQTENVLAIVLNRTNYGEADKIVTCLTNGGNKISFIAKGVRKPKSKLVAGTELFCVSDICYVMGKGSLATLTSARLVRQHTRFLSDLDKVGLAYDVIKTVHKHTEETAGAQYFAILQQLFAVLDSAEYDNTIVTLWAWLLVLQQSGHQLQLVKQTNGAAFSDTATYAFDPESGGFIVSKSGNYVAHHIKLLRLAQTQSLPVLHRVHMAPAYAHELLPIIKQFVESTY